MDEIWEQDSDDNPMFYLLNERSYLIGISTPWLSDPTVYPIADENYFRRYLNDKTSIF